MPKSLKRHFATRKKARTIDVIFIAKKARTIDVIFTAKNNKK